VVEHPAHPPDDLGPDRVTHTAEYAAHPGSSRRSRTPIGGLKVRRRAGNVGSFQGAVKAGLRRTREFSRLLRRGGRHLL
jgi:hypothetical protein